ncbi:hypothetical protein FRB95_008723 [Tulasnella sp. JGI-2019a]|nr:hypothetical protein FRB93_008580 [Tulasnella sp. JGI-2019a]KAG9026522.1 hypothetical protein FRB95_008723 [Tulasnella sp. JGI-2019a]
MNEGGRPSSALDSRIFLCQSSRLETWYYLRPPVAPHSIVGGNLNSPIPPAHLARPKTARADHRLRWRVLQLVGFVSLAPALYALWMMATTPTTDYAVGAALIPSFTTPLAGQSGLRVGAPVEGTAVAVLTNSTDLQWCFRGRHSQIAFYLNQKIQVTRIGVSRVKSATQKELFSSPSHFTAWAIFQTTPPQLLSVPPQVGPRPKLLKSGWKHFQIGSFLFDIRDSARQQAFFVGEDWMKWKVPVLAVVLGFDGNWGNPEETCIHQVHVFGSPLP